METPCVRCNVHRSLQLEVIERDGMFFVKTCPQCEAVAVVKTKRAVRTNMMKSLNFPVRLDLLV